MSGQERSGVLMVAAAVGLLYLFVTGGLAKLTGQLTGALSGAPTSNPYPVRALITKHGGR